MNQLKEVARIIAENGVSRLPVVDDERGVVGIISEKDFLTLMGTGRWVSFMEVIAACLNGRGCPAVSLKRRTAEDLMTRPAITASEDDTASEMSDILSSSGINRIPTRDARQRQHKHGRWGNDERSLQVRHVVCSCRSGAGSNDDVNGRSDTQDILIRF